MERGNGLERVRGQYHPRPPSITSAHYQRTPYSAHRLSHKGGSAIHEENGCSEHENHPSQLSVHGHGRPETAVRVNSFSILCRDGRPLTGSRAYLSAGDGRRAPRKSAPTPKPQIPPDSVLDAAVLSMARTKHCNNSTGAVVASFQVFNSEKPPLPPPLTADGPVKLSPLWAAEKVRHKKSIKKNSSVHSVTKSEIPNDTESVTDDAESLLSGRRRRKSGGNSTKKRRKSHSRRRSSKAGVHPESASLPTSSRDSDHSSTSNSPRVVGNGLARASSARERRRDGAPLKSPFVHPDYPIGGNFTGLRRTNSAHSRRDVDYDEPLVNGGVTAMANIKDYLPNISDLKIQAKNTTESDALDSGHVSQTPSCSVTSAVSVIWTGGDRSDSETSSSGNSSDGDAEELASSNFLGSEDGDTGSINSGLFDDAEEDALDCLDDDIPPEVEAEESTITSSVNYLSAPRRRSIPLLFSVTGEELAPALPALIPSKFTGVPPVVHFVKEGDRVESLDWKHRKLLKWRLSNITPNVVKRAINRSGFSIAKKSYDWIGYFGQHMKPPGFRNIREYQKVNHIPGSFQIGRKDRLWRNLSRLQSQYGHRDFDFLPRTYCLPGDLRQLKQVWDEGSKQKWIIKPPASARGIGIRVVHKWGQIPKRRAVVVQRYIARPYLINGSKFDLRVYVYVSSFDPLRIYVHEDGLVRFASTQYSCLTRNLSNRFMHLTNYSVNKRNSNYEANDDESQCQGHKWSLRSLWTYLGERGVDTKAVWCRVKDLVVKTMMAAESPANSLVKMYCRRRACVHELLGFDVLLDADLKPWILEVNISPSLHTNSPLDVQVKSTMIRDMFNLAGFQVPDKADMASSPALLGGGVLPPGYCPPNNVCADKRLWENFTPLSPDERAKHTYYCQRASDPQIQSTILQVLTPDDIRMLIECVDEWSRAGGFDRVFPLPGESGANYMRYLSQPRYYNMLVLAYLNKYENNEQAGIALLESSCRRGIHLECPTTDPGHQWIPPNLSTSSLGSLRTGRSPSAPIRRSSSLRKISLQTAGKTGAS